VGASEIIASQVAAGILVDLRHRIEVVDENGTVTATVRFGDLFTGYCDLFPKH
jgi:CRISPR/Cas system-associated protein Csm6